jgi:preprotein translocase subunit SecA
MTDTVKTAPHAADHVHGPDCDHDHGHDHGPAHGQVGHIHGPDCNHGHSHHAPIEQYFRPTAKIGRNEPCPCGSGKKHKKCCLNA